MVLMKIKYGFLSVNRNGSINRAIYSIALNGKEKRCLQKPGTNIPLV
jgi:hypothetical protein